MDTLITITLVLHFAGIAAIFLDLLLQAPAMRDGTAKIRPLVQFGGAALLLTGILLIILNVADDEDVNGFKMAVKLAVLVGIMALTLPRLKAEKVPNWVFGGVAALTIANIIIAFVW